MTTLRSIAKRLLLSTLILVCVSYANNLIAQDGKALFSANCASCHAIDKKLTGPALQGVEERWGGDRKKLYAWIKNSGAFLKTGDKYANELFNSYAKMPMTAFDGVLDDKQIDAILDYVKNWKPAVAEKKGGGEATEKEGDGTLLYGILSAILAIIGIVLLRVNATLKKLANEHAGIPTSDPVPVYKNRTYITIAALIFFAIAGFCISKAAIGLGRHKDYVPEQPIFYSHKVHAGINQINCLYCHGGAEQGKHANIPSVNVCMNCHKAISKYNGEQLYTEEGNKVDGSAEIAKLYKAAGFDPDNSASWTPEKATPIEWVKIHNLPDHVYFNHSQHVVAGKVQCQTCHGEIPKMDEVKQFADLSMGWCINCHRESKVQFKDNKFYSIYEKFHKEMKEGKMDSTKGVTVEQIGGTECQKCHY